MGRVIYKIVHWKYRMQFAFPYRLAEKRASFVFLYIVVALIANLAM